MGGRHGCHLYKNINEKKQIFVSRFWFLDVILISHVGMPKVSLVHPYTINSTFACNFSYTERKIIFKVKSIRERIRSQAWCNGYWDCCRGYDCAGRWDHAGRILRRYGSHFRKYYQNYCCDDENDKNTRNDFNRCLSCTTQWRGRRNDRLYTMFLLNRYRRLKRQGWYFRINRCPAALIEFYFFRYCGFADSAEFLSYTLYSSKS